MCLFCVHCYGTYYYCVSSPFRTCISYSRYICIWIQKPLQHENCAAISPRARKQQRRTKENFISFIFRSFFMICTVRIDFSLIFFFFFVLFSAFNFLFSFLFIFFHFTSSIRARTWNRRHSAYIIIIIVIIRARYGAALYDCPEVAAAGRDRLTTAGVGRGGK